MLEYTRVKAANEIIITMNNVSLSCFAEKAPSTPLCENKTHDPEGFATSLPLASVHMGT